MPTTKTPVRKPRAPKSTPAKPKAAPAKTTPPVKAGLHGIPRIVDRVLRFTERTAIRIARLAAKRRKLLHA